MASIRLRNVILNDIADGPTFLGTLVTSVIVARRLGPAGMGRYSYVLWMAGVWWRCATLACPRHLRSLSLNVLKRSRPGAAEIGGRFWPCKPQSYSCKSAGAGVLRYATDTHDAAWIFAVLLVAPMAFQQAFIGLMMGINGRLAQCSPEQWSCTGACPLSLVAGGSPTQFFNGCSSREPS